MTFSEPTQSDIVSLDEEPVNVDIRSGQQQSKEEEAAIEEVDTALPEGNGVRDVGEGPITEATIAGQDIPMIVITDATDSSNRKQRSAPVRTASMDYLKVQSPSIQVPV